MNLSEVREATRSHRKFFQTGFSVHKLFIYERIRHAKGFKNEKREIQRSLV